ncbi:MAG TPA: class I adenylate-forming enzyme family protein [Acidimicrobiales bacterium]
MARYLLGNPDGDDVVLVAASGDVFTRPQLRAAVAALAESLSQDGLTKARVGIDLSPSFGAVAAYLALLLNGNTVVVARRIDQPPWPIYLASAALDGIIRPKGLRLEGEAFGSEVGYDVPVEGTAEQLPELAPTDPDAPAINLFTSGTTGRPKIVQISHRAWIESTEAILDVLPLGPDTRTTLILSLAHSFGLSVLHTHLRAGGSLYCVERPEFPGDVLRSLTAGGCNALAGVPTQLRAVTTALRRDPDLAATVAVDVVMQAGGRMEVAEATDLLEVLAADCRLFQMFGQTEAAARISILDAADRARVPASVGKPLRGLTVRILDDAGHELEPGVEGEVVVSGTTLMSGYFDDPDATAEVLRDGWLHTGDYGYLDPEGFLYVTGRRSNFVKIDGERISLEAIEYAAISGSPEVADALVSPLPTDDGGLAVKLSLLLAEPLDEDELGDLHKRLRVQLRRGLGPKAVPTEIDTVTEIAYTPNAKKIRARVIY